MFCPNCGKENPSGSLFCSECGARLSPEQYQPGRPQSAVDISPTKRRPVFLYMVISVILAIMIIAAGLFIWMAKTNDPLHGAKIKKQTILDANGLRVEAKALRYEEDSDHPYQIELEMNNQSTHALMIKCEAVAVNGYTVDAAMDSIIPVGGTISDVLSISERSMQRAGVEIIGTVELVLSASDENGNSSPLSNVLTIQTNKDPKNYSYIDTGDLLYDQNGINLLYVICYPQYTDTYQALEFFIENHTGRSLTVNAKNFAAGEITIKDMALQGQILADTSGYVYLQINRAELDAAGQLPMRDASTVFIFTDSHAGETLFEVPLSFTVR